MKKKIGLLVPFSGEYPQLKRVLLNPYVSYAENNNCEIIKEFVDKGQDKDVAKAVDKLFYSEDVDIIIGYIGYRVGVEMFDRLRKSPDKLFINLSMGEIIPYTHSKINYPDNYLLVSANAWKSIAFLGSWIADQLPAQSCLICTSLYDAGYSLNEAFRIGYHSKHGKELHSCINNTPPNITDLSVLYSEIIRLRPQHLHITLCGKELNSFINDFSLYMDPEYMPSISFAFPVSLKEVKSMHPAFQKTFTCLPDHMYNDDLECLAIDPIGIMITQLAKETISILENEQYTLDTGILSILEMNMHDGTVRKNGFSGSLPASFNSRFNFSAENTLSSWQNPYLCI